MTTIEEKGKTYESRQILFERLTKTLTAFIGLAICPYCGKKLGMSLGKFMLFGKMKAGCDTYCPCGAKMYGTPINLDGEPKYWARSKNPVK